jgi:hypothetical protein
MRELFHVDLNLPKVVVKSDGVAVAVSQLKFNGDHEAFCNGDFRDFLSLISENALWLSSTIVVYSASLYSWGRSSSYRFEFDNEI